MPKPPALDREAAVFGACLAAGLAFLLRVGFVESHPDEDAGLAIGWLLARGWRLYRDVFTHHPPTDYLPSAALALVGRPSPEAARVLMLAAWAGACAALFGIARKRPGGAGVACAYTVLSASWLTYWQGQLLLVETWIGHACVLGLALLGSPLAILPSGDRRSALLLGVLLGFLLLASPTFLPAGLLLAAWAAADPAWHKRRKELAKGAAASSAAWLLWAAVASDLPSAYDHVVRFNAGTYTRFLGLDADHPLSSTVLAVLRENLRAFALAPVWTSLDRFFEGLLRLTALGWCAWLWAGGRRWASAWFSALWFWLSPRLDPLALAAPFHRAPFFFVATFVCSHAAARGGPWLLGQGLPGAAAAALAGSLLAFSLIPTAIAAHALREFREKDEPMEAIVAATTDCLPARARVAAFPMSPGFHLATRREPALPAVFYLPWQAAWPPSRNRVVEAWDRSPPAAVVISGSGIVWGARWENYARDLQERLVKGYSPVLTWEDRADGRLQLWLPKAAAEAFVRCARQAKGGLDAG